MNKLKLAAGVTLLLIVGALAGSLGTVIYYKKRVEKFEAGSLPISERVRIVSGRFSDELNLTNEQRIEFEKIVRESQEKILALGRELLPEIEEINEQTFASIKDKLTVEQKDKLEVLIQRMENLRHRFPSGKSRFQRKPEQRAPTEGPPDQGPLQGVPGQEFLDRMPDQAFTRGKSEAVTPHRRYEHLIAEMRDRLDLSQEQEAKVLEILEERDRLRREMMENEKSVDKSLSDILTEDQMEKYRLYREERLFKMPSPDMP